jgi:hypothetical protein
MRCVARALSPVVNTRVGQRDTTLFMHHTYEQQRVDGWPHRYIHIVKLYLYLWLAVVDAVRFLIVTLAWQIIRV